MSLSPQDGGSAVHVTPESSLGHPCSRTEAPGLARQHPYIQGAGPRAKLEACVPRAPA